MSPPWLPPPPPPCPPTCHSGWRGRRSGADAPSHSRTILTSHTVEFTTHNIMMWDILSSTAEFLGWTELKTLFTKIISDTNHPVRVCQNLSFPQDGHPLR